jgi:DNA-binding NtrC family response regulator
MYHRILIVDDRDSILFAMSEYFIINGYQVDCARKVEEAELFLANISYSVVISDLNLNGNQELEGLDIVARVHKRFPQTRTILLTAYGTPDVEVMAKSLGVDAFLCKSKPLNEVARVVISLLESEPEEVKISEDNRFLLTG